MSERDSVVTENASIEDLPLSCAAVSYLKSKNIKIIKDLRNFKIDECRSIDSKMADEIAEGIEPYLQEFCNTKEKSQLSAPAADVVSPDRVISPFLGMYLTKEEQASASLVPLESLDIVRFKLLMKHLRKKNINTVGDIIKIPTMEILKFRGMGRGRLSIIQAIIKDVILKKRGKHGRKLGASQSEMVFSPLIEEHLTLTEVAKASSISLQGLDIARFKLLMNALRKQKITTVADIVKLKPIKLLKIRGVGKSKISSIKECIRETIFECGDRDAAIAQNANQSELLLGRILSKQEEDLLGDTPIEGVIDDGRACKAFRKLKKKTIVAATRMTKWQFSSIKGVSDKTLDKVIEAIEGALKELSCNIHDIQLNELDIKHIVDEHILSPLPEEHIIILKDRYGLWDGIVETLEDISHKLNLTRERVRQIQKYSEDRIKRHIIPRMLVRRLFDKFRLLAQEELKEKFYGLGSCAELENLIFGIDKEALTIDLAYKMLKDICYPDENPLAEGLISCGDGIVAIDNKRKEELENICEAAELALVSKGKPQPMSELIKHIPKISGCAIDSAFVKRCVELYPRIGIDEAGNVGLKRWPYFASKNLENMARMALAELGTPSHYSYIVAKMNVMFPNRAPFSGGSIGNAMASHPDIFTRAGRRGTYALVDWGIKKYPHIKDFLAQELRESNSPLSEDELVKRGIAKYGYREASIRMTLGLEKRRFKKHADGSYTLHR